ncbi:MAG: cell division topological specificity factor MinE [Comamonadaceae bacterium]|nr:cell division topological specificity factor MinE [Comamonadaceae bacterium]
MALIDVLFGKKNKSASVAKERLKIILAHERSDRTTSKPDFLADLQKDLLQVISKYIRIEPQDIKVNLDKQGNLEVLEVKIEMPDELPHKA